jgi:hypothetical protein
MLDDVIDRDRVRVLESRGEAGLPHGATDHDGVRLGRLALGLEHLEGHGAAESLVPCLPYRAHPTGPDETDEPVAACDQAVRRVHTTLLLSRFSEV